MTTRNGFLLFLTYLSLNFFLGCSDFYGPIKSDSSACITSECHTSDIIKKISPASDKIRLHYGKNLICKDCHSEFNDNGKNKDKRIVTEDRSMKKNYYNLKPALSWDKYVKTCSVILCHAGEASKILMNIRIPACISCHGLKSMAHPVLR